jgi:Ca2+-binding EF-hand superfamily protein
MGQVEGLMKEFDSNHDGSIDFNEFKDMVEAVQNGKLVELNSDEEIQAPKDTREEEFERIMEVNR